MAIPGHDFLTAHFCNNERTTVESYWVTPDGLETRVEYIEAKEGDPNWENLLTHIDIDALHEATYKQIRAQNEAFKEDVIKIAKERGLIHDLTNLNEVDTMNLSYSLSLANLTQKKTKKNCSCLSLNYLKLQK